MRHQLEIALLYTNESKTREQIAEEADETAQYFIGKLADIQNMLLKDVQAGFDGDPAAKSRQVIISSYTGVFAIFVYRMAHELYVRQVPFIPRIMSEYAHSRTGIDINPGAVIGEYFFIDHGMGVVIGETAEVGDDVTIYHGVTLGGVSLKKEKRHPTIGNNVVIGAGAKVLGPFRVGDRVRIGANSVVLHEVPDDATVVGVPGRITGDIKRQDMFNHTELPDPVANAFNCIVDRIVEMEKEIQTIKKNDR